MVVLTGGKEIGGVPMVEDVIVVSFVALELRYLGAHQISRLATSVSRVTRVVVQIGFLVSDMAHLQHRHGITHGTQRMLTHLGVVRSDIAAGFVVTARIGRAERSR